MRSTKEDIRSAARALGIDHIGFALAQELGSASGLEGWLRRSYHGTMTWMERLADRRRDPRRVLDRAGTVISIATNYFHPHSHDRGGTTGRISRYAWGANYHKLVKKQLLTLVERLRRDAPSLRARAYVDTGPILEKAWAHRAGVGWVGKNANVITRDLGSWVFLGEILVEETFEPDPPATDHCGSCTRCIDACPTGAIVAPTVVDSRRCISYLTIEHRGAIDPSLRPGMGDWVFGCDVCQDVCPWNKFQRPASEPRYAPRPGNRAPDLAGLAGLDRHAFDRRFEGTNVRRAGWVGFLRNVMVALGNARLPERTVAPLSRALDHPEPLVRGHAAWALGRLGERRPLRARRRTETEPTVQTELDSALA